MYCWMWCSWEYWVRIQHHWMASNASSIERTPLTSLNLTVLEHVTSTKCQTQTWWTSAVKIRPVFPFSGWVSRNHFTKAMGQLGTFLPLWVRSHVTFLPDMKWNKLETQPKSVSKTQVKSCFQTSTPHPGSRKRPFHSCTDLHSEIPPDARHSYGSPWQQKRWSDKCRNKHQQMVQVSTSSNLFPCHEGLFFITHNSSKIGTAHETAKNSYIWTSPKKVLYLGHGLPMLPGQRFQASTCSHSPTTVEHCVLPVF